jgi:DNA-binding CsgD family transcriptional regulator
MGLPFVGRAAELAALNELLDESAAGQGRFVTLTGEAGIGKSQLLAQCAQLAPARGHQVLWSQMIEDPAAPPYYPWTALLRPFLQGGGADVLDGMPVSAATALAGILPEIAERTGASRTRRARVSSGELTRLADGIGHLLLESARRAPLVLLFDNLDQADQASLMLLESFGHQIVSAPVLIIATYRAGAVDEQHPLRATLAHVTRNAAHRAMELKGLSAEEVGDLLRERLQMPLPGMVVRSVHDRTDGNPLFVVEAARRLAQIDRAELLQSASGDFSFPDSLREIVASRLLSLTPSTRHLLGLAAVLGRDFALDALCELSGGDEAGVVSTLSPAVASGLVARVRPGHYRFEHAMHREVVYSGLEDDVRQLMHRRAAEHIERRHAEDLEPWHARIAHHYFEGAPFGVADRAVRYGVLAAEAASARRAHDEAAAAYEHALQAADLDAGAGPRQRFGLLKALGISQYRSGQLSGASSNLLKAALLAQRHRWWQHLTEAVIAFQRVHRHLSILHVASVPLHRLALDHTPPESPGQRALLLSSLATAYHLVGDRERERTALYESLELARRCDDPETLLACLEASWNVLIFVGEQHERLALVEESVAIAREIDDPVQLLESLKMMPFPLCDLGQIDRLERMLPEFRNLATQERYPHHLNLAIGFETALAILQGRWADATELARRGLNHAPVQGVGGQDGRFAFQVFTIRRLQGRLQAVAPLLEAIIAQRGDAGLWLPGQILLYCELGKHDRARSLIARLNHRLDTPTDDLELISLVYLGEAAEMLGAAGLAARVFERLLPYRGLNVNLHSAVMLGAVSGYLAPLAEQLRKRRLARELYEEALTMNAAMGAAPALARTQVDYATLLRRDAKPGEQSRAAELLRDAASTADAFGLAPLRARIDALGVGTCPATLSRREFAVLARVARGDSNKQIAGVLHISHSTVATHLRNILRKTGTRNRTEAVAFARHHGWLDAS